MRLDCNENPEGTLRTVDLTQTALARTISDPSLPAIGTAFGVGYLAALLPATDGRLYALVVAPKAEGEKDKVKWKTSYTKTEGTRSTIDGFANSEAMNNTEHPAAQFCRALRIGGFDDWYLPGSAEQAAIWASLDPNHTPVAAFQKGEEQAYEEAWYWSSSEFDSGFAWGQGFGVGYQVTVLKDCAHRCRAVRKLILI